MHHRILFDGNDRYVVIVPVGHKHIFFRGRQGVGTGTPNSGDALHRRTHQVSRFGAGHHLRVTGTGQADRENRKGLGGVHPAKAGNREGIVPDPHFHLFTAIGESGKIERHLLHVLRSDPPYHAVSEHPHIGHIGPFRIRGEADPEGVPSHRDIVQQPARSGVQDHHSEPDLVHRIEGLPVRGKDQVADIAVGIIHAVRHKGAIQKSLRLPGGQIEPVDPVFLSSRHVDHPVVRGDRQPHEYGGQHSPVGGGPGRHLLHFRLIR